MGIYLSTVILCIQLAPIMSSSWLGDPGSSHKSWNAVGPVVDLGYAQYQGLTNISTNIISFLGIRYAAPLTGKPMLYLELWRFSSFDIEGSLRFQAPQSPDNMTGIQTATSFPPQCLRTVYSLSMPRRYLVFLCLKILFFSVFIPQIATAVGLPVVVWIHGGGHAYSSIRIVHLILITLMKVSGRKYEPVSWAEPGCWFAQPSDFRHHPVLPWGIW